jgi:hypothetical protein
VKKRKIDVSTQIFSRQNSYLLLLLFGASFCAESVYPEEIKPKDLTAANLFETTKVWSVHLRFTQSEWAAMEPKQNEQPRRPESGFSPATLMAPSFIKDGNADHDGRLSKAEFLRLGEKWFTLWDKEQRGALSSNQIKSGL